MGIKERDFRVLLHMNKHIKYKVQEDKDIEHEEPDYFISHSSLYNSFLFILFSVLYNYIYFYFELLIFYILVLYLFLFDVSFFIIFYMMSTLNSPRVIATPVYLFSRKNTNSSTPRKGLSLSLSKVNLSK